MQEGAAVMRCVWAIAEHGGGESAGNSESAVKGKRAGNSESAGKGKRAGKDAPDSDTANPSMMVRRGYKMSALTKRAAA